MITLVIVTHLKSMIMIRVNLIFKHCASLIHLPKLTMVLMILFVLGMSTAINVNAQRHGSSVNGRSGISRGYSGGFSGGNRLSQGFSRANSAHVYTGSFNHGYHGWNNFHRYRSLPYWRYAFMPFWGDYYWGIPPYSLWFYLNGYNYYDNDGIYYKYDDNKYQVVPAPIGHKVKTLPKGSTQFSLDGTTYFYYFGSYYVPQDGQYMVVEPPIGAEVDSIPDGYEKVMIDGQTYFTLNGVQYKAVLRHNAVWYQVIKNNVNNETQPNSQKGEQPVPDESMGHK